MSLDLSENGNVQRDNLVAKLTLKDMATYFVASGQATKEYDMTIADVNGDDKVAWQYFAATVLTPDRAPCPPGEGASDAGANKEFCERFADCWSNDQIDVIQAKARESATTLSLSLSEEYGDAGTCSVVEGNVLIMDYASGGEACVLSYPPFSFTHVVVLCSRRGGVGASRAMCTRALHATALRAFARYREGQVHPRQRPGQVRHGGRADPS